MPAAEGRTTLAGPVPGLRARTYTVYLALLLSCLAGPVLASEGLPAGDDTPGWELIDEADGVRVWRDTGSDADLRGFRGRAHVDVPIARLVGLLTDGSKATDWVHRLVESEVLRRPAADQTVVYNRYALLWPVQDRDYVLHRRLEVDPDARTVTVTYRSTEDPARPPADCCVRAVTERTVWRFVRLAPERTRVEVEAFTDPRGSLPAWAVNAIQRDWPRNSILGLTARAARPDVTPHPQLADW